MTKKNRNLKNIRLNIFEFVRDQKNPENSANESHTSEDSFQNTLWPKLEEHEEILLQASTFQNVRQRLGSVDKNRAISMQNLTEKSTQGLYSSQRAFEGS